MHLDHDVGHDLVAIHLLIEYKRRAYSAQADMRCLHLLASMMSQASGLLGKRFLEKVSCEKFYQHFDEQFPDYYSKNPEKTKMHVVSLVRISPVLAIKNHGMPMMNFDELRTLPTCTLIACQSVDMQSEWKPVCEDMLGHEGHHAHMPKDAF